MAATPFAQPGTLGFSYNSRLDIRLASEDLTHMARMNSTTKRMNLEAAACPGSDPPKSHWPRAVPAMHRLPRQSVRDAANISRADQVLKCACVVLGLVLPCFAQVQQSSIRFRDISHRSGINTIPHGSADRRYLVEMMGGGIALFDCDNDGMLDILTVNDSSVDHYLQGGDLMVTLYRQDSALHFTDITVQAGLTTRGWGMGVAIGDFDNDGLQDIYVTGYGNNVLYHNLGGCKFEDITEKAHVAGGGFSAAAAWADYDRDGHLDLFVSRYVNSDLHHLPQPGSRSFDYQGVSMEVPRLDGQTNFLFRNRGDGVFEDVSAKAGVDNAEKRLGMGVVWGDYDNDGWPDLFVADDMGPNYLYRNRHDGTFVDVALWSGTAVDDQGKSLSNMAADFGDAYHDGNLALLVTRYMHQPMSLYRNLNRQEFADATRASHLSSSPGAFVRWGSGFADFDNDGWPDVFVANGNFSPLTDVLPHEPRFREPLQVFRNSGNGIYADVSDQSGLNDGPLQSRRGTAFGDINNDGNVDVVVYNEGAPPSVYLNETRNSNHRVLFRLVGTKSNKAAIGARVIVTTPSMEQIDEVRGGGSYLSSNDQRLHFGLGSERVMQRVQILWPSGLKEELKDLPADAIYTLVEGQGIKQTVRLSLPDK
ncbi:MAG: CRTAC1 family protein [Terracidiphilus sp.]